MSESRRILLVASPGGHLLQMFALRPAWKDFDRKWVTLASSDSDYLLQGETVIHAHGPTPRNIPNMLRNARLAWRVLRRDRPDAILSTGAALAVPFFYVGRLLGCRLVYVESFTRVKRPGLSGRIIYPITDTYFKQWSTCAAGPKAVFAGSVL